MKSLTFKIHNELPNGLGRAGEINTNHGNIKTPALPPFPFRISKKTPYFPTGPKEDQKIAGSKLNFLVLIRRMLALFWEKIPKG